jgi:anti-sigma B factor antagonist
VWRAQEHEESGVRVLKLEGELDLSVASEFEQEIIRSLDRASEGVCIDLTDVSYLDSSSVRALLRASEAAEDSGKKLQVTGASGITRRVLELTGVDEVLGLRPN